LEGELNVLVGDRTVTATTGAFVLVPRGSVHTFSKTGTASAKILVTIPQQASRSSLRRSRTPLNLEKIKALAPKYNLEIVGPAPEKGGGSHKKAPLPSN
jgi:Cupin domain